jgi:hypothetical protein
VQDAAEPVHSVLTEVPPLLPLPVLPPVLLLPVLLPVPPLLPVELEVHWDAQLVAAHESALWTQLLHAGVMACWQLCRQPLSPGLQAQKHSKYPLQLPVTHDTSAGQLPSRHDQHAPLMEVLVHEGPL